MDFSATIGPNHNYNNLLFFALPLYQELAITSDEALSLEDSPKHAVILGGGYDFQNISMKLIKVNFCNFSISGV